MRGIPGLEILDFNTKIKENTRFWTPTYFFGRSLARSQFFVNKKCFFWRGLRSTPGPIFCQQKCFWGRLRLTFYAGTHFLSCLFWGGAPAAYDRRRDPLLLSPLPVFVCPVTPNCPVTRELPRYENLPRLPGYAKRPSCPVASARLLPGY